MSPPSDGGGPGIVSVSSRVATGAVGNSRIEAAFRLLAPAVSLSTIDTVQWTAPGNVPTRAGPTLGVADLGAMMAALRSRWWLTGYLRSAEQVRVVATALARIDGAAVLVDPVLGDMGRVYIDIRAAEAMRAELVPLADFLFPNETEARYLALGEADPSPRPNPATLAGFLLARHPRLRGLAITGIDRDDGRIATLAATRDGSAEFSVRKIPGTHQGTGDYFAGAMAALLMTGVEFPEAVNRAQRAVAESLEGAVAR